MAPNIKKPKIDDDINQIMVEHSVNVHKTAVATPAPRAASKRDFDDETDHIPKNKPSYVDTDQIMLDDPIE